MKIYTKTGDAGDTGLFGGARVSKASLRVDAYGDVDELNSLLGQCACTARIDGVRQELISIQGELFCVGGELASNPDKSLQTGLPMVDDTGIERMEACIDRLEADLPPLTTFILPGGSPSASSLHLARTVCRRAERKAVALADGSVLRPEVLRYLNRLSDLLFVMARSENRAAGVADIPWEGRT